jgi:hypothetical protein
LHTDLKVTASPHLNLSLSQITHSSVKEENEPCRIILPWQSDRGMLEIRDAEVDVCTHQGCGYGTDTWGWHCILWHGWGKSLVKSLVTMFPMFKWYGIVVICWKFMLGLLSVWTDSGHCYVGRMCEWWVHLMAGLMGNKCLLRVPACIPGSLQQSSFVLAGEILDQLQKSFKVYV